MTYQSKHKYKYIANMYVFICVCLFGLFCKGDEKILGK